MLCKQCIVSSDCLPGPTTPAHVNSMPNSTLCFTDINSTELSYPRQQHRYPMHATGRADDNGVTVKILPKKLQKSKTSCSCCRRTMHPRFPYYMQSWASGSASCTRQTLLQEQNSHYLVSSSSFELLTAGQHLLALWCTRLWPSLPMWRGQSCSLELQRVLPSLDPKKQKQNRGQQSGYQCDTCVAEPG